MQELHLKHLNTLCGTATPVFSLPITAASFFRMDPPSTSPISLNRRKHHQTVSTHSESKKVSLPIAAASFFRMDPPSTSPISLNRRKHHQTVSTRALYSFWRQLRCTASGGSCLSISQAGLQTFIIRINIESFLVRRGNVLDLVQAFQSNRNTSIA